MMCSHTLIPEELSEGKMPLGIQGTGVKQHSNISSDAAAEAKDVRLTHSRHTKWR